MTELNLNLDLDAISDEDVTLLQEEGSRGMPEFAASCCDDSCAGASGSCDPPDQDTVQEGSVSSSELSLF